MPAETTRARAATLACDALRVQSDEENSLRRRTAVAVSMVGVGRIGCARRAPVAKAPEGRGAGGRRGSSTPNV